MARILVAEDDDGVRRLVERALRLEGHDVTAVPDGEAAFETLNAERGDFDLLLSDIRMPAMTGIELAHRAAAAWPDVTILLMTGFAEMREAAEDLTRIVAGVLDKPFALVELRRAVVSALAGPQGRPTRREGLTTFA